MSRNSENIFFNLFRFSFCNPSTESDFQKMKQEKLNFYNKFILCVMIFETVLCSAFNSFFVDKYNSNNALKFYFISSYASSIVYFILLIIGWKSKNIRLTKWIHYLTYYFKIYFTISTRHIIIYCTDVDTTSIFSIFQLYEINFRLIWVLFYIHSFYQNLFLNILSIASLYLTIPFFSTNEGNLKAMQDIKTYSFFLASVSCFCYILERSLRTSYYYNWLARKKAEWLSNVLNNINSGFISMKEGKVSFINMFLLNYLKKLKVNGRLESQRNDIQNLSSQTERKETIIPISERNLREERYALNLNNTTTSKIHSIDDHKETVETLFNLLSNLNTDSIILSDFRCIFKDSSINHKNYYEIFIKSISQIPKIENFKLIGDITIETEDIDVSFEIHCRYYNSEKEGELEILFNDVTRTKTKEKQNAEFKYKSLFLSKVAHEFKNPLICIGELIEQSHDQVSADSNLKKTLDQIKSLSNFLLVLVKDLNYFSEYQMGKNSTSFEKETDLFELVDFCKNITNSLLVKAGKYSSINFNINLDDLLPRNIFTDEWRLKQVLINLLSNSVKFTMIGNIYLQIKIDINDFNEKILVFSVKDTGIGMNDVMSKNLFKPFNKGNFKYNEMGSGLGLVIVNEIASKLGSGVKFHSLPNQGSHFWFSIPLKKANSISHLEKIEYINNSGDRSFSKETRKISGYVLNKILSDSIENIYYKNDIVQLLDVADFADKNNVSNLSINKSTRTLNELSERKELNNRFNERKKTSKSQSINIIGKNQIENCHNKNKVECNFKLNVQEFAKLDISKINSKKDTRNVVNLKINNFNINANNMTIAPKKEPSVALLDSEDSLNILVVDDEVFTRQSTVRILYNTSKTLNMKINIIEADDGLECIYLVYKCITQGVKISMILSDENMNFMYGSRSAEILKEIISKKRIAEIPFYLLTAYDNTLIEKYVSPCISQILSKPLTKDEGKKLLLKAVDIIS